MLDDMDLMTCGLPRFKLSAPVPKSPADAPIHRVLSIPFVNSCGLRRSLSAPLGSTLSPARAEAQCKDCFAAPQAIRGMHSTCR
jgi:hypothetical protein